MTQRSNLMKFLYSPLSPLWPSVHSTAIYPSPKALYPLYGPLSPLLLSVLSEGLYPLYALCPLLPPNGPLPPLRPSVPFMTFCHPLRSSVPFITFCHPLQLSASSTTLCVSMDLCPLWSPLSLLWPYAPLSPLWLSVPSMALSRLDGFFCILDGLLSPLRLSVSSTRQVISHCITK
jgi:hypothetical protein